MTALFEANTANEVWLQAHSQLQRVANAPRASRLGPTREILHASFQIADPRQRWVLSRLPAFNPAFAVAEVFWILAGENDAAFLNFWNPKLPKFSGTSAKYHGAYGYRIRRQFKFDQLEKAFSALSSNPSSRQVVIQIWDPQSDFPSDDGTPANPDIPCNICSMPKVRDGKLEWLQVMRSNDLYLGTPHNIIQFTTLQEILAGWLGLELGAYHHISDSLHVYETDMDALKADATINIPKNTDNLSLKKDEFEIQLRAISSSLKILSSHDLSIDTFNSIIEDIQLHQGYKNLLAIAAADSARRRMWPNEMKKSLSKCSNDLLILAFNRWESRYPVKMQ